MSTASGWALATSDTAAPAPLFSYSAVPPAGPLPGSGASVHIPFSSDADVTWTWDTASRADLLPPIRASRTGCSTARRSRPSTSSS